MKEGKRSSLTLRLPSPLRDWLTEQARQNFTSQNDEIIRCIRERIEMTAGVKASETDPAVIERTDALASVNSTNG